MSRWHRPHVWLVRKKFAGMIPRTFVSADEGKNGLAGPRPSSFMLAATTLGLTMRYVRRRAASRAAHWKVAAMATTRTVDNEARAVQAMCPGASCETLRQR